MDSLFISLLKNRNKYFARCLNEDYMVDNVSSFFSFLFLKEFLFIFIVSIFSLLQTIKLRMCGSKSYPRDVNPYSTCGGISEYIFRYTTPSDSRERRVTVSIFWDISPTALLNSLNRRLSILPKISTINMDHLFPMPFKMDLTGQSLFNLSSVFIVIFSLFLYGGKRYFMERSTSFTKRTIV